MAPSIESLLVVEDDPGTRSGLVAGLEGAPGIEAVHAVETLAAARSAVQARRPDVILLDLGLPDGNGLALLVEIRDLVVPPRCLILSALDDEEHIVRGIRLGADGYLLKQDTAADLQRALFDILAGRPPLSPAVAQCILAHLRAGPAPVPTNPDSDDVLPPRQFQTLTLLARGLTYNEIARHMDITFNTVSTHAQEIYNKLAARSRAEAVHKAREMGLL